MQEAKDDPRDEDQDRREDPVDAIAVQKLDEDHPEERENRPDRKVDAASDDDETLADREQPVEADQIRGVGNVERRDEAGVDHRHDGPDDQDKQQQA